MDSGTLASVFFIVVILGILLAIFLINEYRHRTWLDQHLKGRWGAVPDREYTSEELESISHYALHHRKEKFYVDDITWNDLGLEEIFMLLNNTVSSCGEEYLYYMLRNSGAEERSSPCERGADGMVPDASRGAAAAAENFL